MSTAKSKLIIGALVCLAGIGVTAATYSAAKGGGTYVVAYGAIALGALQMIRGLIQLSGNADGEPDEAATIPMLALHAMAYVAATDGTVSQKECRAINAILTRITGSGLPEDKVESLLKKLGGMPFDGSEQFERSLAALTADDRHMIVKCALLAGASDNGISDEEWERVCHVAVALEISSDELQVQVELLVGQSSATPGASQAEAAASR